MSNAIAPASVPSRRFQLRRCSFRFDGRPQSVKAARDWLNTRMNVAAVPEETAHTARLLLSELATNALAHRWGRFKSGRGPGMFFELRWNQPGRDSALAPAYESAR